MSNKMTFLSITAVVCALLLVVTCSAAFGDPPVNPGDTWIQSFTSGYARIDLTSTASLVNDHYHYEYVLTLWRTGGSSSMNMSAFSVGAIPIYFYENTNNTKGTDYFTNPVWASDQTSVRWNRPTGGTVLYFPSSPATDTITFSFDSAYMPEVVDFTASGGLFSAIGGKTWGMSEHTPEPTSIVALGLGCLGIGGALLRRFKIRH